MDYSLISLFLLSVCLFYAEAGAFSEQNQKCEYDSGELNKNRQSHEKGNTFYVECQSNGDLLEKQCADGLIFDEETLVNF